MSEQPGNALAPSQPAILTAKEVKDKLRCGLSTVYELYEAGELRGFRLKAGRGGIRIYANSVDELMARNTNQPTREMASSPVKRKPDPNPKHRAGRPRVKTRHYEDLVAVHY